MKKILTITSSFLLVIALLFVGSAFILGKFLDPNKFKGKISQYVYAKSGQVLVINGDMHWSLFPWVGLKATDLTYYNAPNFTPKTFVFAKEMDIKVKLIPLITGKMEIGNITLENAVVNLIKNKSGQLNWQTLAKQDKKTTVTEGENNKSSSLMNNLSIASLKIKNSKLNWYDQQKNSHTSINGLNINSKNIQFGRPFPLSLDFILLDEHNTKNMSLDMNTDVTLSTDYTQLVLKNIAIKSQYFAKENKINLNVAGNLATDLKKQTLLTNLNYEVNNVKGQISLNGSHIAKKPHFYGTFSTDEFNLKQMLQDFGKPADMKSNKALKSFSLLSKVDINGSAIQFNNLHAKIDETDFYGNVNLLPPNKNIQFNLLANKITIDDYLADKESSKTKNFGSISEEKAEPSSPSPWAISGVLKVSDVNVDKLKLTNLVANVNMKKNIIQISPLRANLYNGQLMGEVTLDKHQSNKTAIYIKQSLKNINIKELLHEFSNSDKLSGTTDVTADLVSVTNENTSFMSALSGKINFVLTNGSLQGMDFIYQLSKAHAFLKHIPSPSISDSKQTEFSSLTASAVINNGVMNTDDISLTSEYLKVNGKGLTNLVNKEIRYRLNALAQPKLANENKEIGKEVTAYQVPIKVSGKLTKPNVNIDFVELAKIFYSKEIEKPISKQLEKNINHLKENLKTQVQDKIKGLTPSSFLDKLISSKPDEKQQESEESSASINAEE